MEKKGFEVTKEMEDRARRFAETIQGLRSEDLERLYWLAEGMKLARVGA